jgi:hypothetical protein
MSSATSEKQPISIKILRNKTDSQKTAMAKTFLQRLAENGNMSLHDLPPIIPIILLHLT